MLIIFGLVFWIFRFKITLLLPLDSGHQIKENIVECETFRDSGQGASLTHRFSPINPSNFQKKYTPSSTRGRRQSVYGYCISDFLVRRGRTLNTTNYPSAFQLVKDIRREFGNDKPAVHFI